MVLGIRKLTFLSMGFTLACTGPDGAVPARVILEKMSDQELVNTIGFGRLRLDVERHQEWECVGTPHTEACTPQGLPSGPAVDAGYFYLFTNPELNTRICNSVGRCVDAEVLRGNGGIWVEERIQVDSSRNPEKVYIEASPDGGFVGTYFTQTDGYRGGTVASVYWKGKVLIDQTSVGVGFDVDGPWSLEPMTVRFDQAVHCEHLSPKIVAASGKPVGFTLQSQCSEEAASMQAPRVTSWLRFVPDSFWPDLEYTLSFPGLRGVSGFEPSPILSGSHRVDPWRNSADSLDFEQAEGSPWTSLPGSEALCRVFSAVENQHGPVILPSSGSGLMRCYSADWNGVDFARAQLAIPPGATRLLFDMSAMDGLKDENPGGRLEMIEMKARYNRSEEISVLQAAQIVGPEEKPSNWSGWHQVQLDLQPDASMIELTFGLSECWGRGIDCKDSTSVALDHFRFE